MTNKYLKMCSASLAIKEMQMWTVWRVSLPLVRMTMIMTKKRQQMLARLWGKRKSHPLLVGVWTAAPAMEISMQALQNTETGSTLRPSSSTLEQIPKGLCVHSPQRYLHIHFCSCPVHSSQEMEPAMTRTQNNDTYIWRCHDETHRSAY